jgi:hypothetical protein
MVWLMFLCLLTTVGHSEDIKMAITDETKQEDIIVPDVKYILTIEVLNKISYSDSRGDGRREFTNTFDVAVTREFYDSVELGQVMSCRKISDNGNEWQSVRIDKKYTKGEIPMADPKPWYIEALFTLNWLYSFVMLLK